MLVNLLMDLYSQLTSPNMQKPHIRQKFIHCNNNGLLGMKQWRMVLHTSAILTHSTILNLLRITWAVYGSTHHWTANQPMFIMTE